MIVVPGTRGEIKSRSEQQGMPALSAPPSVAVDPLSVARGSSRGGDRPRSLALEGASGAHDDPIVQGAKGELFAFVERA
jgi:hypothetical protein